MSKDYLPSNIDPFKAAAHGAKLHGFLKIQEMTKLNPLLYSNQGEVEVGLEFDKDQQGVCVIKGHISATLELQCQRCMKSFNYEIIDDFISGIVDNEEQSSELSDSYDDVIVVKEAGMTIKDMIEDNLIVSLPIVPVHDPDVCGIRLPFVAGEEPVAEDNPFNVISILRSKPASKKE